MPARAPREEGGEAALLAQSNRYNIDLGPRLLLSAGGSPQPATSALLAAIPEDALIAVHVPDPRAIIAARETNAMVGFMLDPEWESIAALFMGEDEESVRMLDELKGLRQQAIEAMSDAAGLVAFATAAPAGPVTTLLPGFEQPLHLDSTLGGAPVLVPVTFDATGQTAWTINNPGFSSGLNATAQTVALSTNGGISSSDAISLQIAQ